MEISPVVIGTPFRPEAVHFPGLDYCRVFGAFGIVWFHAGELPAREIAYSGLPIFLIIFFFLVILRGSQLSASAFLKNRSRRLLLPWFFWTIVYGGAHFINNFISHDELVDSVSFNFFLIGTNIHLWFLPFAFIFSLFCYFICYGNFLQSIYAKITLVLSVFSMLCAAFIMSKNAMRPPLPQWIFSLPSIFIAFYFAKVSTLDKNQKLIHIFLLCGAIVATSALIKFAMNSDMGITYFFCCLILSVCFFQFQNPSIFVIELSALSYGIYLIHPLIYAFLNKVAIFQSIFPLWSEAIAAFAVSALVTFYMKKTVMRVFV